MPLHLFCRHALIAAVLSLPVHALVIAGPNGTGAGNTTQASLNAYTTATAKPVFPYWQNVIPVSDSSGIYLGNVGGYGWVMTAAHVTSPPFANIITVAGTPFTIRDNIQVASTDIRLYRIGGEIGDSALPPLPNVPITTGSPPIGTAILDFGRGGRVEGTASSNANSDIANAPGTNATAFEWAPAASAPMRWGTNVTASTSIFAGSTTPFILIPGLSSTDSFVSTFNPSPGSYLTSTEAGLSVSDSGGPVFVVNGGAWQLAGLNAFTTGDAGLTAFGDYSGYNNLASYAPAIAALMVPEPSTASLAALVLLGLTRRRRA
jgi:hypothetical protein